MKKRLLVFIAILTMVFTLFSVEMGYAASATMALSGSTSVTKGSTVSITVKFSDAKFGATDTRITYDPEVLEYVSCSDATANANNGTILATKFTNESQSTMSFKVSFKAKKTGSTTVEASCESLYNFDGEALNVKGKSIKISIIDKAASNDANLKSLSISKGSLNPSFSKSTTEYTVNVGNEVTQFLVTPKASNPDATVEVTGSKQLAVGENTRAVTVTAPSGDTKTYTIKIIRASGSGSSDPGQVEDNVNITIGEDKFTVIDNLSSVNIPEGFSLETAKFGDKEIVLIKSNDGFVSMAYLKKATDDSKGWYFYDEEKQKFSETSFLKPEEILQFANNIAAQYQKDEPTEPVDDPVDPGYTAKLNPQTLFLAAVVAGTLFILLVVVLCLQIKIMKKRKN